jgi:hypothetical protein
MLALRLVAFDENGEDMKATACFYLALIGVWLLLRGKRQPSDLMQPWIRAYPERIG